MTDLDAERFTLRQAAQARDDFAMIMDELHFVKSSWPAFRPAGIRPSPRSA